MLNSIRGWSFLLVLDIIVAGLLAAIVTTAFREPISAFLYATAQMFLSLAQAGAC